MKVPEKAWLWLGIALAAVLLGFAVFGEQGWQEVRRLRAERALLAEEIERLRERRGALEKEIAALRGDSRAIEAKARRDLGMIREGETVFLLPERHGAKR